MTGSPDDTAPTAWILAQPEAAGVRIFGLSPEERLRRSLLRAGCTRVETLTEGAPAPGGGVFVRGDVLVDERVLAGLVAARNAVLEAPRVEATGWGGPVAAHVDAAHAAAAVDLLRAPDGAVPPEDLTRVSPAEIAPAYVAALRKFEPPWVVPARRGDARAIEDRLFAASYKSITDLVTKWLWPVPAAAVTRVLARFRVHPNTITLLGWLLTIAATWLFFEGRFGLGLVAAWLMTFLDTVDGKLARVTLTSSRIGHVLDHGLDIVHPPFWYLAWGLALGPADAAATAIVVVGYVVGRLVEGAFMLAFDIETHSWRPIDSLFRTITARRNPNLILLSVGALGGRPDLGMWMVALWTLVSLAFHGARLVQAFAARRGGATIAAWHAPPAPREAGPAAGAGGD